MENKTLTPYFRNLPLSEAWEGDFGLLSMAGMPPGQLKCLTDVCKDTPKSTKAVYDFLVDKDPLFRDIYSDGTFIDQEEQFVFPFIVGKKIPEDIKEVVGPIGTQTSKYHQETLQQHVELVVANLIDVGIDEALAVRLAVLHDIGKKYTSATNAVGGVCYYNHAELSAFIAGHWLRQSYDEKSAKEIVAIIYDHMLPFTSWNVERHWKTGEPVNYRQDFYGVLLRYIDNDVAAADRIMSTIDTFAECDEGVAEFSPAILEKIARGHGLICN